MIRIRETKEDNGDGGISSSSSRNSRINSKAGKIRHLRDISKDSINFNKIVICEKY